MFTVKSRMRKNGAVPRPGQLARHRGARYVILTVVQFYKPDGRIRIELTLERLSVYKAQTRIKK